MEIGGSIAGGWITTSIDGRMGYSRDRDVDASADETITADGTVSDSDDTQTHTMQTSFGDFTISSGGSFDDGDVSVGFSQDYDLFFSDSQEELLIVEDGTLLTDDVTQTNNTDSTYTQSQSLSATDFSSTTTASGGNQAGNVITRDLTAETLEGSTLDWSTYASSTTTPEGTTEVSGSSSDDTLYKFVRALVPPGDQNGWQPQVYEHHTVYSKQTTYPH